MKHDIDLAPGEFITPYAQDEVQLWYATNLHRIAAEDSRYGATLLRINGREVPCLCIRAPDDEVWYRVIAPGTWGPLFEATEEAGIRSERRPDGVLEFWCHRRLMSPLAHWINAKGHDGP